MFNYSSAIFILQEFQKTPSIILIVSEWQTFAKNQKIDKKFRSQLQNKWKIAYIFMELIDNNGVVALLQ